MSVDNGYFESIDALSRIIAEAAVDAMLGDPEYDPDKPTVILLPGGLGSRLMRARTAFNPSHPHATPHWKTLWASCGLVFDQTADDLYIDAEGLDVGRRIIVASGDVRFVVHPYESAIHALRHFGCNVLTLGWDWRRDVEGAAALLNYAIGHLQLELANRHNVASLRNTWLLGHSMGGMVAKLFLSNNPHVGDQLAGFISVGTPFYGYFGQMQRTYDGLELFNALYGAPTVARVTSSMPGMYSLWPIDRFTYDRDHIALNIGPYPVTDANSGDPVDPYSAAALQRWPNWVRKDLMPSGLETRHKLAAPLPADLAARVHHIRGMQPDSTQHAATWAAQLPNNFAAGDTPSPVQFVKGAGDDVIPLWSARLASTPDCNVHDLDTGEHAFQLQRSAVMRIVLGIILNGETIEQSALDRFDFDPAISSVEEAQKFMIAVKRGEVGNGKAFKPGHPGELVPLEIIRRIMHHGYL